MSILFVRWFEIIYLIAVILTWPKNIQWNIWIVSLRSSLKKGGILAVHITKIDKQLHKKFLLEGLQERNHLQDKNKTLWLFQKKKNLDKINLSYKNLFRWVLRHRILLKKFVNTSHFLTEKLLYLSSTKTFMGLITHKKFVWKRG